MNQQLITALYCRLSIGDDNDGDSNSIQNQRLLLSTYANEQKFPNQRFFVDDGYTGTNFNRPAMQELLALVDAGEVGIICVKDLSRFGRDYLTVGNYLERIRAVTAYVRKDAEGFQLDWMQCRRSQQLKSIQQDKKRLEQAKQRIETLDKLITRVYEDYALGNLPLERYQKMAAAYEKEKEGLRFEVDALESMIAAVETQTDNYDHFAALIKKYVEIPELTQTIVNEFVKKIIVSAPDKSSGKRRQRIKIIFNYVGDINIPILTDETTIDPKCFRKSKGAA